MCTAVGIERADVIGVVGRLVAKSLVTADRGSLAMLVTIRDYASERLDAFGLEPEARRAHALRLVDIAAALGPSLMSGDQLSAIDVLAARDDDLIGALDWCESAGEQEAAVALTAALGWYWYVRGAWWAARRRLESVLAGRVVTRSRVASASAGSGTSRSSRTPTSRSRWARPGNSTRADGRPATRCSRRGPTCS